MDGESKPLETPDAFLKTLGESLKAKAGVDTDLTGILTTHILKATPAQNAVAQAKDAIVKLAGERANPPKIEVARWCGRNAASNCLRIPTRIPV